MVNLEQIELKEVNNEAASEATFKEPELFTKELQDSEKQTNV